MYYKYLVSFVWLLLQSIVLATASAVDRALACPEGWTEAAERCFKIFDSTYRSPWDEARTFCQSVAEGADLAVIESFEVEQEVFTVDYMENWIGLHWNSSTERWYWVDGSRLDGYVNWIYEEAGFMYDAQQCACITGSSFYATWSSHACEGYRSPSCQMPKTEDPSTVVLPTMAPPALCNGKFSDWHQFGKHCYKIVSEYSEWLNWHDARSYCRAAGGELASAHSLTDLKHLLTMVGMNSQPNVPPPDTWIGLRRHSLDPNSDQFHWSDGTLVDFQYWFPSEPGNFADAESCVQIYPNNGFWNDFNCAVKGAFICQACRDNCYVSVKPTEPIPVGHCDDGWFGNGPWCYKVYPMDPEIEEKATFDRAREQCRADGAWVASVHSDAENAFIQMMSSFATINHDEPGKVWLGLTDFTESDMEFFWEDESTLDYVNWAEAEPDNLPELDECNPSMWAQANCVAMDVKSGQWYTEDCDDDDELHVAHGFVCRKVSSPPYATPAPPPRCDSPYEDFDDVGHYCLMVVDEPMTWQDAESKCREYPHAHLASIMNEEENAKTFTKAYQKLTGVQQIWLGLSFYEKYGEYQWSDERPMVFAKWAAGQPPANDTSSMCGAMSMEHGSWETMKCNGEEEAKLPFLCKYAGEITAATPSPLENGECEENWMDGGHEHCYFISTSEAASFEEAETSCDREGAHLASIHNHNENQKILEMLKNSEKPAYLGLAGNTQDGFSWSDGSPITYQNWEENQPSGDQFATMCVSMSHDMDGKWREAPCDTSQSFICKKLKIYIEEGNNDDEDNSGPDTGLVIGMVVLAIAVVAGGLTIGLFLYSKK